MNHMQKKTRAIVLRRIAYGDADWIVTLFSEDSGKMAGMAKSARNSKRRFGGAFEPGTLVEIRYSETRGNLARLEEARVLRPVTGIVRSLERIAAMTRAVELALAFLQDGQAAPEKFAMLEAYLGALCESDPAAWDTVSHGYRWLAHCGYRPNISECAMCRKKYPDGERWSFDLDCGGLLCDACSAHGPVPYGTGHGPVPYGTGHGRARIHLSRAALVGLTSLSDGSRDAPDGGAAAAGQIIDRYMEHIIGRPLMSRMM